MQADCVRAAPDAAAQLVQLRQAEALGVFDDHQAGIGHIDADFDHRGRHQHVDFVGDEGRHHRGFFAGLEPAVHQADAQLGQFGSEPRIGFLRGLELQNVFGSGRYA